MSKHGTDYLPGNIPDIDNTMVTDKEQAVTSATDYDGTAVNLPEGYAGGMGLFFLFSGFAGGTSVTPKMLCGGSLEQTGPTIATASIPSMYVFAIPAGETTVNSRVTSLGTHTAGEFTAFVAPLKF